MSRLLKKTIKCVVAKSTENRDCGETVSVSRVRVQIRYSRLASFEFVMAPGFNRIPRKQNPRFSCLPTEIKIIRKVKGLVIRLVTRVSNDCDVTVTNQAGIVN